MSNYDEQRGRERDERQGRRASWLRGRRGVAIVALFAAVVAVGLPGVLASAGAVPLAGGSHVKDVYTTLYANFSGNYTVTSYSVVSNVTYLEATTYRTITGNVTGVELADELGVVQANGSASIAGHGFFVGSVLGGAPGHALLSWSNVVGTFGVSVTGIIHLSYGTGGLAGVVGWGSATVAFGSGTSFSGSYVLHLDLA